MAKCPSFSTISMRVYVTFLSWSILFLTPELALGPSLDFYNLTGLVIFMVLSPVDLFEFWVCLELVLELRDVYLECLRL